MQLFVCGYPLREFQEDCISQGSIYMSEWGVSHLNDLQAAVKLIQQWLVVKRKIPRS